MECTEERRRVGLYWEKDAEDGVGRKEETGRSKTGLWML